MPALEAVGKEVATTPSEAPVMPKSFDLFSDNKEAEGTSMLLLLRVYR